MKHSLSLDRQKTIQNMKNKILNSTVTRNIDNATSTFLREGIRRKKTNPFLNFKQQNVEDNIYRLGREEYMVDVMTIQQLLIYEHFATLNHCMDFFHRTNINKLLQFWYPMNLDIGIQLVFTFQTKKMNTLYQVF